MECALRAKLMIAQACELLYESGCCLLSFLARFYIPYFDHTVSRTTSESFQGFWVFCHSIDAITVKYYHQQQQCIIRSVRFIQDIMIDTSTGYLRDEEWNNYKLRRMAYTWPFPIWARNGAGFVSSRSIWRMVLEKDLYSRLHIPANILSNLVALRARVYSMPELQISQDRPSTKESGY